MARRRAGGFGAVALGLMVLAGSLRPLPARAQLVLPGGFDGPMAELLDDGLQQQQQLQQQLQQQRCNTGRFLGGLAGGGIGYASSRGDGRSWAVPLGVLVGLQLGCNAAGSGRVGFW
ncbi:MAG: hypothetical protein ACKO2F_11220 [Cyanobacteriota bacterium]